jgi:hypothetical protein
LGKKAAALLSLSLVCLAAAGCGERSDLGIARRILETHRRKARVKPLPGAQVVRLALTAAGSKGEAGTGRIEWDGQNYRETVDSAGWTTVRGIQAGKAFWTDEDSVTRVCSEPVLAELLTRSYFWRRAYLFDDLAGARLSLGPAEGKTVSVELRPRGGNPLRLTFVQGGDLLSARSPGFAVDFRGPSAFTDRSRPDAPVDAEIRAVSLPSNALADKEAGGWSATWTSSPAEVSLSRAGGGIAMDGAIAGVPTRIAFDGSADGPLEIRAGLAQRLGLAPRMDVYGRRVARAGPLTVGSVSWPELLVQVSDRLPEGCDARAGGVFLRETVVELEAPANRIRLYDPRKWSPPPGFFKGLLDDDGDRATAILTFDGKLLRLRAGVPGPPILLAREAARRVGLPESGQAELKWGTAPLPPLAISFPALSVSFPASGFDTEWGEDGALGQDVILRFHTFLDLPRRWAYLRPLDAGKVLSPSKN